MSKKVLVSPPLFPASDHDWCETPHPPRGNHTYHWWLCNSGASEWWDLRSARSIEIVLSSEPNGEGFQCRLNNDLYDLQIRAAGASWEEASGYGLYSKLYDLMDQMPTRFYMSINVLEKSR